MRCIKPLKGVSLPSEQWVLENCERLLSELVPDNLQARDVRAIKAS